MNQPIQLSGTGVNRADCGSELLKLGDNIVFVNTPWSSRREWSGSAGGWRGSAGHGPDRLSYGRWRSELQPKLHSQFVARSDAGANRARERRGNKDGHRKRTDDKSQ